MEIVQRFNQIFKQTAIELKRGPANRYKENAASTDKHRKKRQRYQAREIVHCSHSLFCSKTRGDDHESWDIEHNIRGASNQTSSSADACATRISRFYRNIMLVRTVYFGCCFLRILEYKSGKRKETASGDKRTKNACHWHKALENEQPVPHIGKCTWGSFLIGLRGVVWLIFFHDSCNYIVTTHSWWYL